MNRSIVRPLLAALLLASAAGAARADGPPDINIKTICDRGAVGESNAQEACSKDERDAKSELVKTWGTIPADVRTSCSDEIRIGGTPSYVELLTCAQMHKWSREGVGGRDNGGIPPVNPQ